ncbi:MAG: sigma-70 region 2 domain protein [Aeromicrobium sp.]|nr:sigma-70 region 2 domain protein [Aeromicrobium sp.]
MPAHDVALIQQLHDEHATVLYQYVLRLTNQDHGLAEDVVQETMLRGWRHLSNLDKSQGSVRGWLFTVARNLVIDEWRSRRSRVELVVADVPDAPTDVDQTDWLIQAWVVGEAVTRLSADHRAVLLECYYRDASVAEAARNLGIPEGTVKSRTHYALRALRLAMEEMGVGR